MITTKLNNKIFFFIQVKTEEIIKIIIQTIMSSKIITSTIKLKKILTQMRNTIHLTRTNNKINNITNSKIYNRLIKI